MFRQNITDEEINELETVQFEGPIHIIIDDSQIDSAVKKLKEQNAIGFDTETKPCYKKNTRNKVSLLQLATENEAFIFKLHSLKKYEKIFSVLSDPKITKVGVAVDGDLKELVKLKKFRPSNFIELQSYVKIFKIENISLKKLCAIVLNIKISKRQQRSNWEAEELSEAQIKYAATDAWASLLIYKKLKSSQSEL